MSSKKLRVNSEFVEGYKKGEIVGIDVDSEGVPMDRFWRKQLQNAKQDNCCEFVETKKPKKEYDR